MVKALYVHCPKTAGTSIRKALGASDATFADCRASTFDARQTADIVSFSHVTPRGLLASGHVTRDDIEAWYVFATIRNPWDRLVSGYFRGVQHYDPVIRSLFAPWPEFSDFAEWVVHATDIPVPDGGGMKAAEWTHPQVNWFYLDGSCIVDAFVRVEHLADDWRIVCAQLGIECSGGRHGAV